MFDIGFIYALKNLNFGEGIYKIGMTQKDPQERAKELSSQTSVPSPFEIVAAIKVINPNEAERFIHDRLSEYRVNRKKEFFKVELSRLRIAMNETAYEFRLPIIKNIEKEYNKAYDDLRQFTLSFEKIRNLCDYQNFYEYEFIEFRNILDKNETLQVTFIDNVAERIRTQAQKEKKSVNNFIKDIVIAHLD